MTQPIPPKPRPAARPETPAPPAQPASRERRSGSSSRIAILVFLGSLLGSLIGTFSSIDDVFNSFGRIAQIINPPPTLCVAGSNTILGDGLGLAEDWKADFESRVPSKITYEKVGSLGGVNRAVEGGCVNVLASSEALTSTQLQRLATAQIEVACAAEIGYDVLAFVTDTNNPLGSLEERFLAIMLNGNVTHWNEVRSSQTTPIYIYVRPQSGTTDYVLKAYGWTGAEQDQYPAGAQYITCSSNEECLDLTLSTEGSLYWVSSAWMHTQPPQYLRVLPILVGDEQPINPLQDADFDIRDYPSRLVRPLYLYVLKSATTSKESLALAEQFLRYARGVNGQKLLEKYHFRTYFNHPKGVTLDFPTVFNTSSADERRPLCRSMAGSAIS